MNNYEKKQHYENEKLTTCDHFLLTYVGIRTRFYLYSRNKWGKSRWQNRRFRKKMKERGFEVDGEESGGVILKGEIGEESVKMFAMSTKEGIVHTAGYVFPKSDTWYSLKSKFNLVKDMLTEKYGKPQKSDNTFSRPYYEGDGYEMSAVSNNKCHYNAKWTNQNILMLISSDKTIIVFYENKMNSEKKEQEKKNNLKRGL